MQNIITELPGPGAYLRCYYASAQNVMQVNLDLKEPGIGEFLNEVLKRMTLAFTLESLVKGQPPKFYRIARIKDGFHIDLYPTPLHGAPWSSYWGVRTWIPQASRR